MANYIVPQVLINQLISEVSLNTVKNQNVLVIGPNYELFRFDSAEEKEKTYIGQYVNSTGQEGGGSVVDPSGMEYSVDNGNAYENKVLHVDNLADEDVVPYPSQAGGTVPDGGYTRVYADEVLVKLASLGDFELLDDEETEGLDARLRFPYALTGSRRGCATAVSLRCAYPADDCNCVDTCGRPKNPYRVVSYVTDSDDILTQVVDLKRDIAPGDAIRIRYGSDPDAVYKSTVVEVFESVPGSEIFDSVQLADTIPSALLDSERMTTDAIACNESDPFSVAGEIKYWFLAEAEPIGPVVPGGSNDECGEYDSTDSSEGGGADVPFSVQLCAQFSGVEIARKTDVRHVWNWDVYADTSAGNDGDVFGVVVTGNLKARYSNWAESDSVTGESPEYRVLSARLYVQHRDLVSASSTDISSISSSTLVEATLGTVHPDNPLAFGVYMAAINSGDRLVYFCGVPTDDLDGYNTVLGKASLTEDVYIICPTTTDSSVAQAVKSHVLEMSTAQNKLWRIGFVSVEPPATDAIYDRTNNPSGEDFYGMFRFEGDTFPESGCNLVQFMKDFNPQNDQVNTDVQFKTYVRTGDILRIWLDNSADDWDDTPNYSEFVVSKVVSNNVVRLSSKVLQCGDVCDPDMIPAGKGKAHFRMEIHRKLTAAQQAGYIAAQSSQLATRRMYNVFPSIASNAGVSFDGSFVACAVSGLVSSVLPQQPVTNVAVNGIDDIPVVYQTYTKAQLDEIAAGGTFIVMQDRPGSQVYVRHQISTDYTSGNLLKSELSVTKNLDSISYYFAELFAPYIGKYNVTPDLIGVLRNVLQSGLTALETETAAGLYGPQVLEDGTEIVELKQSEVNRDHVYGRVRLNLPVPFNYFDLDLEI